MGNTTTTNPTGGTNNASFKSDLQKYYTKSQTKEILQSIQDAHMTIDHIDENGNIFLKAKAGSHEYTIKGQKAFIDKTFDDKSYYGLNDILTTIDQTPPLFKQELKSITLSNDPHRSSSGLGNSSYYDLDGNISLHSDFLDNDPKIQDFRGVIIHELTHNLDFNGGDGLHHAKYGYGQYYSGYISDINTFQFMTNGEPVSVYAKSYRKDDRYYSENLAEIMYMTGGSKFNPNITISTPTEYLLVDERLNYSDWKQKYPEAAKLGEVIWNAKSRDDIYKYLLDLRGKPIEGQPFSYPF